MPYANNNGVSIHYKVEGQGTPFILLHGGFGSLQDFYEFNYVSSLKDSYQLILIDMRAMGQSDKPTEPKQYSMKILAGDVIAVLDNLNVEKAHFYGHSLGGWIAFALAKYYPNRLISIINSDGVPSSHDPEVMKGFIEVDKAQLSDMGVFSDAWIERILLNDKPALYAMVEWLDTDVKNVIEDIKHTIDTITLPSLFIQSNAIKEGTEEFELIQQAVTTIANAKEVKFDDLNHITVFTNSEFVLPVIHDFLGEISV